MAKLLIATESLAKVDPKVQKELKENLKQKQRARREHRIRKHTSAIRQLLDQGGSKEDIKAALECLQADTEIDLTMSATDVDDETDASSSSE
jgi:dihydrodipicolinate synthase/N-acetylneuraminate lyase